MRVIFFGTPPFAAAVLDFLVQRSVSVLAVVTRPAKPKGRSSSLVSSAVAELAASLDIPVLTPLKIASPESVQSLSQLQADLFVVVAYGQILPQSVLNIAPLGCINLHASLLPYYRGAAPIQRALMAGESRTGVTIIAMNAQMDAGNILKMVAVPIAPETTFGELEQNLLIVGQEALFSVLNELEEGSVTSVVQNHEMATFAPKITSNDEQIHWEHSAEHIHNQVRALSPRPGAWCYVQIAEDVKRLKIFQTQQVFWEGGLPGEILVRSSTELVIACGQQALRILRVQPEGRRAMKVDEYLRGIGKQFCVH